jgi:hypothetical protein
MNLNLNSITLPIIAILIGVIVLYREGCIGGTKCPQPQIVVKHDTIYDRHSDTVYKQGEVISHTQHIPHEILTAIHDTVHTIDYLNSMLCDSIYRAYHAVWVYSDTERSKYGDFFIKDTVQRNNITGRGIIANWHIPTAITTTEVVQPKTQLYLGASLGSTGRRVGFGPDVLLKTKQDKVYGIGAYATPDGMFYKASMYWKIHF